MCDLRSVSIAFYTYRGIAQFLIYYFQVDPAIMGGIVVNIGDKFIDMSTATKVKKYANLLKEAV